MSLACQSPWMLSSARLRRGLMVNTAVSSITTPSPIMNLRMDITSAPVKTREREICSMRIEGRSSQIETRNSVVHNEAHGENRKILAGGRYPPGGFFVSVHSKGF